MQDCWLPKHSSAETPSCSRHISAKARLKHPAQPMLYLQLTGPMSAPSLSGFMAIWTTRGAHLLSPLAGGGLQRSIWARMCDRPAAAWARAWVERGVRGWVGEWGGYVREYWWRCRPGREGLENSSDCAVALAHRGTVPLPCYLQGPCGCLPGHKRLQMHRLRHWMA